MCTFRYSYGFTQPIRSVFSSILTAVALFFFILIISLGENEAMAQLHGPMQSAWKMMDRPLQNQYGESSYAISSKTPFQDLSTNIPNLLTPWIGWVLQGHEKELWCIPRYNDSRQMECLWPSRLNLVIDADGGHFTQSWHAAWGSQIPLPGSDKQWPLDVKINGIPVVVITQNGQPVASFDWEAPGAMGAVKSARSLSLESTMGTASKLTKIPSLKSVMPPLSVSETVGKSKPTSQPVKKITVTGRFAWKELPEYLQIPKRSALISLSMGGEGITFPNLDHSGRVWLKQRFEIKRVKKDEDRLKLQAFRLIEDRIPAAVTLHLSLDVAGSPREVRLGPIASPEDLIPLSLESPLPARLEADATLRIQVKPGQYQLTVKLRNIGPLKTLSLYSPAATVPTAPTPPSKAADASHWPDHEIWAVQRYSDLRIVEISGGMTIDPRRTAIPKAWQSYPAFKMQPGEALTFKEIKRGDPVPAPDQLSLDRTLWLHFDGSGYTIQDNITGTKNSDWRLEMAPTMVPGKVSVDGTEQLITRLNEISSPGVELRKGILNLTAEGRFMGSIGRVPATGWQHEFQTVNGRLHLPPGWKLIHAAGIDNIPRTWVKRWSLLDFFIVLIFTVATAKLYSRPLSAIGFITLVLTWQEPMAPRYIWLYLLGGFAMLRSLPPKGKLMKMAKSYQIITALALIFVSLPYAVQALRVGIYPQLERPWLSMNDHVQQGNRSKGRQYTAASKTFNDTIETNEPQMIQRAPAPKERRNDLKKAIPLAENMFTSRMRSMESDGMAPISGSGYYGGAVKRSSVMQQDPKSLTQTGPGLPLWPPFDTISFSWSGPVAPGETIAFYFTGPLFNAILAFVRVGMIILLTAGLFGAGFKKNNGFIKPGFSAFSSVVLPLLVAGCRVMTATRIIVLGAAIILTISSGSQTIANAGEIPSHEMLNELRERLLKLDDCFPSCADLSEMAIDLRPNDLSITLHIHAAVDTAIPLPGDARHWLPSILRVDENDTPPLFRENEILWMMVTKGHHTVLLEGPIRPRASFQLPLPMTPRHASAKANGWEIQGIQPDGTMASQLGFKRLTGKVGESSGEAGEAKEGMDGKNSANAPPLESGILPAFARVERHLMLGLVWKVETRVVRTTPWDAAMMLSIPLIANESVTTQGIRVVEGKVAVSMSAGQNHIAWESFIDPSDTILLTHADTTAWTEIWTADVSPIFHVETTGIPVILHQVNHRWFPTWHPWPGESVTLTVSRPMGVAGNTLTIESSRLDLSPGRHSSNVVLILDMKSSRGGQHTIKIPEGAELQEVRVNKKVQLIRQKGRTVPLPINPGRQTIQLKWRGSADDAMGMVYRTPQVDLGIPSVNAAVDLHFPRDRWPLLLGGEQLAGPAVLFWSVIIVVLLGAMGLAMTGLTPLKFHHWVLLGMGISMSSVPAALCVAAWLIFMDLRKKADPLADRWHGKGGMDSEMAHSIPRSLSIEKRDGSQIDTEQMDESQGGEPDQEGRKVNMPISPDNTMRENAKRFNLIQIALAGLTLLAGASLFMAISQGLIGHPDMNIIGNGSSADILRWYQDISEPMLPRAWVFSLPMLVYRGAMLAWALWISFAIIYILKWAWQRYSHPVMWISIPKPPKKKFQWQNSFRARKSDPSGDE